MFIVFIINLMHGNQGYKESSECVYFTQKNVINHFTGYQEISFASMEKLNAQC